METKIENATIESVRLGYDRGTWLCPWVALRFDGGGCSMGGYVGDVKDAPERESTTGFQIMRILDTVGVDQWEKLPGMHLRVEHEGMGGGIVAIGHWNKDLWYRPSVELKERFGKKEG